MSVSVCACWHLKLRSTLHKYIYMYAYTNMYRYTHVCIHLFMYDCMYVYDVHINTELYNNAHNRYTYIHKYTYIYIYIHKCIHIHIYTDEASSVAGVFRRSRSICISSLISDSFIRASPCFKRELRCFWINYLQPIPIVSRLSTLSPESSSYTLICIYKDVHIYKWYP